MAKSLFEELGGKYERQGDYLIPCLTVPAEEEQAIGMLGRTAKLKVYAPESYGDLFKRQIDFFMQGMEYEMWIRQDTITWICV